ncbi:MAG: YifB family Mg chelatase-like AAA ATPase [Sphingomonadaceae bacterium]|uniref:YifB family Mg chelatase-like AAA ATPase n=1 Tax=Thermaurantiacus sp. TaxID=2820283 RepID=UPI00298EEF0A|nr:YifB family Mg chelatase-like AAA ATPase [Thermaurantiacus sp.]MCS6987213.1 YifB family Mg chelatase-like AAA ATPase [Sphingomonadaceae bacterium]MDW8414433.1 YifB family Mg chelatase-like AAA ATPase [Thermaurantiacus sp.]
MVVHVATLAFLGLEARPVEVQVQLAPGAFGFQIVGLPDKAVRESRDRIQAALAAMGLALPPRRITVNLAPADLEKAGAHYDLPIAMGLLGALGIVDPETLAGYVAIGELALDGRIAPSPGVLLAALHAAADGKGLVCPAAQGPEAAWLAGADHPVEVVAAPDLAALVAHLKGARPLPPPLPAELRPQPFTGPDLADIKGQETLKRALEIAAAGGHNLLMCGPPGAGKSLLAAALPGILPELSPAEALEVAMIRSVAGELDGRAIPRTWPFRAPHHSASIPALVGGGRLARPGEVSLAHLGVLFLDELPEFPRAVLDSLRQPLERGVVEVARSEAHVTWPARVQLVAAMNPCRCGHLEDAALACARAPRCAADYQARLSGPLLDRIDLHVDVPAVPAGDLTLPPPAEGSAEVARRVAAARARQAARWQDAGLRTNAEADGRLLEERARLTAEAQALLWRAAEAMRLSARAYARVMRVARTIADLAGADAVGRPHVAEALAFRRQPPRN